MLLSRRLSDDLFQEAVRSLISTAYNFTHVKTVVLHVGNSSATL